LKHGVPSLPAVRHLGNHGGKNAVSDVFNELAGRLRFFPALGAARHDHAFCSRLVMDSLMCVPGFRVEVLRANLAKSCVSSGEETGRVSIRPESGQIKNE
jgi:hypothetical protein